LYQGEEEPYYFDETAYTFDKWIRKIVSGDLDDPKSEISQVIARNAVTVRKPHKGTDPNVFYVEGNAAALLLHEP